MGDPLGAFVGVVVIRVMLAGAVLAALWALWNGFYTVAAGLLLALAYFLYLTWRPVSVEEELIDPERWDR